MTLRYGSVCSGIEAASAAWHPLGWTPEFFAEIERFPSEVLAHHYGSNLPGEPWSGNAPPNLGDMTRFQEWPDAVLDVLVGGTPCQSFSVAGLRKGLADPRGNLALTYLALADCYRPRWVVWENVPGVLSSNGGRDFGAFLGGLAELGYGWAYRVLDAQYVRVDGYGRAVPQRRRRVFVVGYAGDWRRAGAVLFERESLSGYPAPRREAREGVAAHAGGGAAFGGGNTGGAIDAAACLTAKGQRIDFEVETFVAQSFRIAGDGAAYDEGAVCAPLTTGTDPNANVVANTLLAKENDSHAADLDTYVAHTLRAEGFDASEDGTGRGIPLVPLHFQGRGSNIDLGQDVCGTLGTNADQASGDAPCVAQGWAVRRLTPTECERLQGFPDGYTAITRNGKPAADGPRYKALGNSMAVNVMRWIGRRIEAVEKLEAELQQGRAA